MGELASEGMRLGHLTEENERLQERVAALEAQLAEISGTSGREAGSAKTGGARGALHETGPDQVKQRAAAAVEKGVKPAGGEARLILPPPPSLFPFPSLLFSPSLR